jgi:carbohydrate-binding DOMON domain-containing protein
MNQHSDHADLMSGFIKQQQDILDNSNQGIYVYLDDNCRSCNANFAKMLGYISPSDWINVDVKGGFPRTFVDSNSQSTLVGAYQNAMNSSVATNIKVTWKTKSRGTVNTNVIILPIAYQDHLLAMHFVTPVDQS